MEDTIVFRELSSDKWEFSLVFHNSWEMVLRYLKHVSISMLMFGGWGLGFGVSSYGGVWLELSLGSILIMFATIK